MHRFLTFLLAAGLCACSKGKAQPEATTALGEPVGTNIDANAKMPATSIAFAVTKGQDPVPMLPKIVTAVSQAIMACPAIVDEAKASPADVVPVDFAIEGGKVKPVSRPASEATKGRECLAQAMLGKELGPATTPKLDGRVEIKLTP
jgi:hypothetical protein